MTNPKVSILMPSYNAERYIGEAIESILNQTFKDFEFIILDDCSKDKTWEIINEYTKSDSRIKAFKNEINLGIAGSRNKLVSLAVSKYIAWQDADDISFPERIEEEYIFMENNPKVGIVGGFLEIFDEKKIVGIRRYKEFDEELRKSIFRYSPVAQPAAMIRKECFEEVGLYDLNCPVAQDLDMSFRIGRKYKFANIQKRLIKYRENETSATFTKLKTTELKTISIRLRYTDNVIYKMNTFDHLYNALQYISIFIIPSRVKIKIFDFFRNKKL